MLAVMAVPAKARQGLCTLFKRVADMGLKRCRAGGNEINIAGGNDHLSLYAAQLGTSARDSRMER